MKNLRFTPLLLAALALAGGCKRGPEASAAAKTTTASALTPSPAGPAPGDSAPATPAGAPAPQPAGALGPLQRYALPSGERLSFDAVVLERLDAGSYGYLRVARDDGSAPAWVATLRPSVEVGARVHVTAFGRAHDFDSRRLKRRFDELYFAAVRRA